MIDISTTEVLIKVKKNIPGIPGNGKFKNAKYPVPTLREETPARSVVFTTEIASLMVQLSPTAVGHVLG